MTGEPFDPGLQPERTRLAWQRTAASIAVGALVYARVEADFLGPLSLLVGLLGALLGLAIGHRSRARYRYTHLSLNAGIVRLPDGLLPLAVAGVVFGAGLLALAVAIFQIVAP